MFHSKFETHFPVGVEREAGLRSYMLRIYNYMTGALVLTGLVGFFAAHSPATLHAMYVMDNDMIFGLKPLGWLVMLAPLGLVLFLSLGLQGMSTGAAQIAYWSYASLIGLSLSVFFLAYTNESIARAFFITAGTFAGMSIVGYTTRKDLTELGSFLVMGLLGLIIASLVNLFLKSGSFQFWLSAASVLVFVGLTAFDTQKLKELYGLSAEGDADSKIAIMGALTLYLDFINIFLNLLNLLGSRRQR
jgi:FtsH-binding integral membrane protein